MTVDIDLEWLQRPSLQILLNLLSKEGEEARVNGGAVRNTLLGEPVHDVDVSSTMLPADVIEKLEAAGHRAIPTGIDHGTVTALVDGDAYEVTTLRTDISTDGRHAEVSFGKDWMQDARRRDFTINALYLDAAGELFDPLGGRPDIEMRRVRFIDDAEQRIREDYLRILRFFRMFAWYGEFRPDAEGLKACTRLKDGLEQLSSERVWLELSKLLAAPDPGRAILWMRQTGVLSKALPESEKWGIDALSSLIACELGNGWAVDPVLRLLAIIPPQEPAIHSLSARLKLPNAVAGRLENWALSIEPDANSSKVEFERFLYRGSVGGIADRLSLAVARDLGKSDNKQSLAQGRKLLKLLKHLRKWNSPQFPVTGRDLVELGFEPGPKYSKMLGEMENRWVESNFSLSKEQLLSALTS